MQNLLGNSGLRFFRLAGDEFAVLADRHITEANFHEDVIMISHYLNPAKLRCFAHEITIRVSIGAVIAARQDSHRPVIAMAGIALKEAKKRPRSYYFYSETADESLQLEHNLTTIERLDYAIKQETVNCHYQPIFNVRTQRVEKFESLIRIVDRDGEVHMPSTFIDIAKGARLYTKLTQQVVLNALAMAEFNPGMHFTINIDVEDIIDVQTTAFIFDQLRQSGSADRIVFELVESGEIDGNEMVKSFFEQLKKIGCKIAVDDFGSGYSNYSYLVALGVDIIKIDGSLIRDIDTDRNKQRITASIINVAHDLGMETVTEFVQNKDVFDTVVALGTDYVQGSFIAAAAEVLHCERFERDGF